jgi:16S rRNA (adenine1518-N6/adenine1519-N6)-dimethyltransferase
MDSAMTVADLLARHGVRPKKSLGQNFLTDRNFLHKIAAAGEIGPEHDVLEVGPGLGGLTAVLAGLAGRVVAVEIDRRLMAPLREVLAPFDNISLVQGDILALSPADLMPEPGYLVVANIPYYITSALIRHLLESEAPPSRLVLTVQQEVAQRICAQPPKMNLLALSVQVYGGVETLFRIPAGAFFPRPGVDSACVRVDLLERPRIPADRLPLFFSLSRAGFAQKRKNLRNALSAGMGWKKTRVEELLAKARIDPRRRAETLDFDEWDGMIAEVSASRP